MEKPPPFNRENFLLFLEEDKKRVHTRLNKYVRPGSSFDDKKREKTIFFSFWFPLDANRDICANCYADSVSNLQFRIDKLQEKVRTFWVEKVKLIIEGNRARLEAEVLQ